MDMFLLMEYFHLSIKKKKKISVLSPIAQQIMGFSLNDLDHWGLSVVLLQVWFCLLQQLFTLIFIVNYQVMCTESSGGSYNFFFVGVWLTRVSRFVCAPDQVCETGDHTHLVILQGEIPLVVAPKCWLGDLNHQEVLFICIMVFHTTCLLFCLKESFL